MPDMDFYQEQVRGTLQDYPELNHILLEREDSEQELNESEIKRSIKRSLAKVNMVPPVTTFELEQFPKTHWLLIVDRAIIESLKMKGILKMRNEMPYQDQGGTSIRLDDKSQKYMRTAQQLMREWKDDVENFKKTLSVQGAWGGVRSEYYNNFWA